MVLLTEQISPRGVTLTDVTFVMDGYRDGEPPLINVKKMVLLWQIIGDALHFRKDYEFKPIPQIQVIVLPLLPIV